MVDPSVAERSEAFRRTIADRLPGRDHGLYLVGSVALGDWQEAVSNIDVVVAADRWEHGEPAALAAAHGILDTPRLPARVAYVTYDQLAGPPSEAAAACFEGAEVLPPEELATPLTWAILAEEAVALEGREYFPVQVDVEAGRRWAADRLAGRWATWVSATRHAPQRGWRRRTLSEDVLEVARLHHLAATGQVVSKLRAATTVTADLPVHFHRILADVAGYRQGSRMSMYWGPLERRTHAVDVVAELVDRAAEGLRPV